MNLFILVLAALRQLVDMATVTTTAEDGTTNDDTQQPEMYSESTLVYMARYAPVFEFVEPERHKARYGMRCI